MSLLFSTWVLATALTAPEPIYQRYTLPHPQGNSYLMVPNSCLQLQCPMLVVSHSRGITANEILYKPHLMRFFKVFVKHDYAVLISNDGGENLWGNAENIDYLKNVWQQAAEKFMFSGQTFTLGFSMGGIPAAITAFKAVFPVSGVILLDARVNLSEAIRGGDKRRTEEINRAFASEEIPVGYEILRDYDNTQKISLFVAGSYEDKAVPFYSNGLAIYQRFAQPSTSKLKVLSGPHLGGSHLADELAEEMVVFLQSLHIHSFKALK